MLADGENFDKPRDPIKINQPVEDLTVSKIPSKIQKEKEDQRKKVLELEKKKKQ